MARLGRVLSAAMIVGAGAALLPASTSAQTSDPQRARQPEAQISHVARLSAGAITGLVLDERGGPVAGARVMATGVTMALAFTDKSGRFQTETLPAGEYVVRAHRSGFIASKREVVRVGGSTATAPQLQMRRLETATGTSGTAETPLPSRPIIAAGFNLPAGETTKEAGNDKDSSKGGHPHSETDWRLRHIKRSILKDQSNAIVLAGNDADFSDESVFDKAIGGAANFAGYASSLFTDYPLKGEVNFLTTSAVGPGQLFAGEGLPRGIAYLALGAPTPAGDWTVRAAMSEGDLASWIVAGSFVSKAGPSHSYTVGLSYSTQDYKGGNPIALAAMRDGSRNAAEIYAFDRWTVTRWFELDYGTRFARYDYVDHRALLSPRVGFAIEPRRGTRISALVTQRMVVPGAEEFLPRAITGPALPPERTFAPFDGRQMRVERARGLELALEHQFDDAYVVSVRRFEQRVDDQLMTMFQLAPDEGSPESIGHYYVGNVGSFNASGWGIRVSTPPAARISGAIDYRVARANWTSIDPTFTDVAPAVVRPETEDIHDITTSVTTDIPETATRFYLIYRVNTAFTRSRDLSHPGMDVRFDMQVNQALPFGLAGTRWEVLVGLRNLFRDPDDPASVYDELLVVRPPKRVIGGFLVKF